MSEHGNEFRKAYLIGVHFIPESVELATLFDSADANRMVEESWPDGRFMRVRSGLHKPLNPLPPFWKDKVQDITLFKKSNIFGSRLLYSHIRLDPYWLNNGEPRWKMRTHINALFASICGRTEVPEGHFVDPCVLYVQGNRRGFLEEGDPFVNELSSVGVHYEKMTAAWISGTLLVPGLSGSNEWKSVSAFDACPDSMHEWADTISVIACDVAEFQAIIELLSRLIDDGYAMPFARRTAVDYVQLFLTARKKEGVLKAYESMFLPDKEKNLDVRHRVERALRQIDELLKENVFFALHDRAEPENDPLVWLGRIPGQIVGKYQEYRQVAERILHDAHEREIAISELLRDRAVAESTRGNIRLQKFMLALALVAAVPILLSAGKAISPYIPKIMDWLHRVVSAVKIHG